MSGPRSLEYQTHLSWDGKSGGEAKFAGHPPLRFDTPAEFGGGGRYPCPDELFFSAIGGCLLTTLLYFKRRAKLEIEDLQVSVKGGGGRISRPRRLSDNGHRGQRINRGEE